MDDLKIVALYNERNEKAIEETSNKYGNYCFNIANNILANAQDSEECVNDTWLKTWNSIPPQQPNCLKLFLAKITRNLSFDKFKHSNREKRGGGEIELTLDEIGEFVASTYEVETEIEKDEFIKTVNRFLYALPERECNVFIRRYFHVESTKVIAEKYDLTESNVLKILSRTRIKLKKFLKMEGYAI